MHSAMPSPTFVLHQNVVLCINVTRAALGGFITLSYIVLPLTSLKLPAFTFLLSSAFTPLQSRLPGLCQLGVRQRPAEVRWSNLAAPPEAHSSTSSTSLHQPQMCVQVTNPYWKCCKPILCGYLLYPGSTVLTYVFHYMSLCSLSYFWKIQDLREQEIGLFFLLIYIPNMRKIALN